VRAAPGPQSATLPRQAWIFLAMLTLGWGFNWPIMKVALSEVPPWTFRTLCLLCAAVSLLALARLGGHRLRVPPGAWLPLSVVALCNITAWSLFSVYGLKLLPAGRAAILAYTMPIWTILLSRWLLGERMTWRRVAGLVLGMTGMLILMGSEVQNLRAAPVGALFMVAAAVSWAVGTVVFKRYPVAMSALAATGWMMVIGGIPIWICTPLLEPHALHPISFWPALGLAYNMIVAFSVCYWAWQKLVTIAPAGVAALSTLMIPVLGVVSGMLLLGEQPRWQEFTALGFVLAALATVLTPSVSANVARRDAKQT
jgi:drug/metabolite transporter (DMT)-like permease